MREKGIGVLSGRGDGSDEKSTPAAALKPPADFAGHPVSMRREFRVFSKSGQYILCGNNLKEAMEGGERWLGARRRNGISHVEVVEVVGVYTSDEAYAAIAKAEGDAGETNTVVERATRSHP